jgi:hypothetical protein
MRTSAFLAAATAILLAAPASAAVKVVDFTLFVGGSLGPDGRQTFSSSPFPGFDPSLGTLKTAAESISGSTTWLPGGHPAELIGRFTNWGRATFQRQSQRYANDQYRLDWCKSLSLQLPARTHTRDPYGDLY